MLLVKENGYELLAITKQKPLRYYHVPIFSPGACSLIKAKRVAVPAHGQQRGPDSYIELCAIASFRDNKIFKSILSGGFLVFLLKVFYYQWPENWNGPSENHQRKRDLPGNCAFYNRKVNRWEVSRRTRGSVKQLLFFPCSVWKKNSFEDSRLCKVFSVTIYQFLAAVDWKKELNLWWSGEGISPLWQCTPGLVSCINYIHTSSGFYSGPIRKKKMCFQENLLICKMDRRLICLLQRRCLYLLMDKRQQKIYCNLLHWNSLQQLSSSSTVCPVTATPTNPPERQTFISTHKPC